MRAELFHYASSLVAKFSEYSEADLTHEVSKLLSEKANLTEALGVSGQFGGLMQATYEEMVGSKDFEMQSGGLGLMIPPLLIGIIILHVVMCCLAMDDTKKNMEKSGKGKKRRRSLLQQGSETAKEARPGFMKKAAMKLFETKFGKGSGTNLQLCMEEMSSKGPSLMKKTGLKLSGLKQALQDSKKDPKRQVKILRQAMTAFMWAHGATIAQHGLDELGIGSCGKVLCAGDLRYSLDASGLHRCEWNCPDSFLPDSFDYVAQSMKNALASLEDAAASDSEVIKTLEEEEDTDDASDGKSELWRVFRGMPIAKGNAHVSNPWSPEGLQMVKMPSATAFTMANVRPTSLYYKGICIPEQDYFKKHSVAIVSASNAKVPKGTVVKLDRVQTTGTGRGAYFTSGEYQKRLRLSDLDFGLIPVDAHGAMQWLAAINASFSGEHIHDPSDPSRVFSRAFGPAEM